MQKIYEIAIKGSESSLDVITVICNSSDTVSLAVAANSYVLLVHGEQISRIPNYANIMYISTNAETSSNPISLLLFPSPKASKMFNRK